MSAQITEELLAKLSPDLRRLLTSKAARKGRIRAIVKTLPGNRRMLLGFERLNKRARHYKAKLLLSKPILL